MTGQYRVLPAADQDLDDQAAYLAADARLELALRFYDAARTTFEHLAAMPGVGERWASSHPRLAGVRVSRIEGFENHLIFYRETAEGIDIIRVLHGARDLDRVLEADE
jgi:toxin ParE1/3/4